MDKELEKKRLIERISQRKRRERLRREGKCPICGKKLDSPMKLCESCRGKHKVIATRKRSYRKQHGLCPVCGRKQYADFKMCKRCLKIARTRQRVNSVRNNEKTRQAYENNKKNGLCRCGQKIQGKGRTTCSSCYSSSSTRQVNRQRNRIENGLCSACGKYPLSTKTLCSKCAESLRLRAQKRIEALSVDGQCILCGKRHLSTKNHCSKCAKRMRTYSRLYYVRQKGENP